MGVSPRAFHSSPTRTGFGGTKLNSIIWRKRSAEKNLRMALAAGPLRLLEGPRGGGAVNARMAFWIILGGGVFGSLGLPPLPGAGPPEVTTLGARVRAGASPIACAIHSAIPS